MKAKLGDYIVITGHPLIGQHKFDELHPNGVFGKIIEIQKRFCSSTGKRRPDKIIARCTVKYRKEKLSRDHRELRNGFYRIIQIN